MRDGRESGSIDSPRAKDTAVGLSGGQQVMGAKLNS